jgi:hypothetical protein
MPFLTSASLKIEESPNSLVFRIERERGWFERVIALSTILFCFWGARNYHSRIWLAFGLVAIAGTFVDWLQGTETEITVTGAEIDARGNVNRMFSSEVLIDSAEVTSMGYSTGGEGDPSGLYVNGKCIAANISEQLTDQIADRIFRKFPEIGNGDTEPGSMLFGKRSEPTALGLSRPE